MNTHKSTHKQTGEVRYGTWETLCDLDKRIWFLEPLKEKEPQPKKPLVEFVTSLCYLFNLTFMDSWKTHIAFIHKVYTPHDLVGYYI